MKSNHHEGHEDHEGLKPALRDVDHEGQNGAQSFMFTLDPKNNFSEAIDFFVFLRVLRGEKSFSVWGHFLFFLHSLHVLHGK
ncbi:MAG: hypothetical protein HF981_11560 [Desulfobacteraceae bacterium]|nr:hypothetical protein [Desulfobacteraceae bacterium]MBC2751013.1 hypothetical protein [Desulfobacteraceae bacterium]